MPYRSTVSLFVPLLLASAPALAQETGAQDEDAARRWGHSSHGSAYDVGPRQRPWVMEGIGSVTFPITTSNPEAQQWFDQAVTLMHGFWWYEAERSLRWCLKLDPECAMAYWGLAITVKNGNDPERSAEFMAKAVELQDQVTRRERDFIEMTRLFQAMYDSEGEEEYGEAATEAMRANDKLLMDYPDDVEAKALYWLLSGEAMRDAHLARYGVEAVIEDALELDPDHVGVLHYRIHNWDGKEGRYVIDTCLKLGDIAPACGHLLHMPGHVLSGIGLWHEAAISMDRATRVEKAYMNERMILPEDNWDYAHNLDYLCYIQEQLGMAEQAIFGAQQLLEAPTFTDSPFFAAVINVPMSRALMKYERWDEILEGERLSWNTESPIEKVLSDYVRLRALIGKGRIDEAREILDSLKTGSEEAASDSGKPNDPEEEYARYMNRAAEAKLQAAEGLILLENGENLRGLSLLTEAAEEQEKNWQNDPPHDEQFFFNLLGEKYLEMGAPRLAAECYERTLETVFHDGFALAGLVVAYAELGETGKAREAMAKLGVVWSDADRPNRWLAAAEATGITAEPHLEILHPDVRVEQRNYREQVLDVLGPSEWVRSEVPPLAALDSEGETVTLDDYRGQNVLLIFYLGEECVHCIEQLVLAEERLGDFEKKNTVVLAVSREEVEEIAEQQPDFGLKLLSDVEFENARRFRSYDDFEEIELHSTFLLDREGRLHWARIGGEPFTDFDYLEKEIDRLNRLADVAVAGALGSQGGASSGQ